MSWDPWGALLWGLLASAAMIIILQGSQSLGLTRLNLPFLVGTLFTGRRHRGTILGIACYFLGGWVFALVYVAIFERLGYVSWWFGTFVGFVHGLFLVVVVMPLLPHIHPRVASEFDGPTSIRRLEPPGAFGLNYGRRTPLTTVLAQTVYGLVLGAFYQVASGAA